MKYLYQGAILLGVSLVGELLHGIIPLAIPASVYGLVLMFLCLSLGVIRLEQVERLADLLIELMPVMFIPAAVRITQSWDTLKQILVPGATIILVTTVLVMGTTGKLAQWMIERREGRQNG